MSRFLVTLFRPSEFITGRVETKSQSIKLSMLKKKLSYILVAILAYIVFVIATLPAVQAYALLKDKIIPHTVVLGEISGTIWSGHAKSALINGQRLTALSWDVRPLSLLLGRMRIDLKLRNGESFGQGSVSRSIGGNIYLNNVEAHIAISDIEPLSTLLPVGLEGYLGMNLVDFEIKDQMINKAVGTLAWQGAAISSPQRVTLGDLRVKLTSEADGVKATLSDGGGPLQAEGLLLIKPDGHYQFTGAFASRDEKQPFLTQSLRFLERQGADSKVKVSYSGSLSDINNLFGSPASSRSRVRK